MDNKEAINYLSKEGKSVFQHDTDMLQAIDMAINSLEEDIDAYEQGYTDGWKERFGEPEEQPQGEWKSLMWVSGKIIGECPFCDGEQVAENYCSYCGARLHGRN